MDVERRRAHAGRRGDVARRRGVEALLRKRDDRGFEQSGARRVGAGEVGLCCHRESIVSVGADVIEEGLVVRLTRILRLCLFDERQCRAP